MFENRPNFPAFSLDLSMMKGAKLAFCCMACSEMLWRCKGSSLLNLSSTMFEFGNAPRGPATFHGTKTIRSLTRNRNIVELQFSTELPFHLHNISEQVIMQIANLALSIIEKSSEKAGKLGRFSNIH